MSTHLDKLLSESLRSRADDGVPIEVGALLAASTARGRRARTRRRVVATAVAVVATVAVGVTAGLALPWRQDSLPVVSVTTAPPDRAGPPRANLALMPDAGVPGAATRPDLVGTDADVLHFSVDALAADATMAFWNSTPGLEVARVARADLYLAVSLAREERFLPADIPGTELSAPAATSVNGRPGTVRTAAAEDQFLFTWQPVDGLWARAEVHTSDPERALAYLAQVSFDQSRKCVTPFRPGGGPAGMVVRDRWTEFRAVDAAEMVVRDSSTEFRAAGVFSSGGITYYEGSRRLRLQAQRGDGGAGAYPIPLTAGPYRVGADPAGDSWSMRHGGILFTAISLRKDAPVTQDTALEIIGDLRISDQLHDPGAW